MQIYCLSIADNINDNDTPGQQNNERKNEKLYLELSRSEGVSGINLKSTRMPFLMLFLFNLHFSKHLSKSRNHSSTRSNSLVFPPNNIKNVLQTRFHHARSAQTAHNPRLNPHNSRTRLPHRHPPHRPGPKHRRAPAREDNLDLRVHHCGQQLHYIRAIDYRAAERAGERGGE